LIVVDRYEETTPGVPAGTIFEVSIGASALPGKYKVDVIESPAGFASSLVDLDVDRLLARRSELQSAILASAVQARRAHLETEKPVREVGQALFTALLGTGDVSGQYRAAVALAASREQALRVVLRIHSPALAALPWEAMYDHASGYVGRQEPLIRHIPALTPPAPVTASPPLRMLAVVSSPSGAPVLDVDKERGLLTSALAEPLRDGLVEIHWAPAATWSGLQTQLIRGHWQVVHFIGHGRFDVNRGEGIIVLTDQGGRADLVEASRFADLLRQARPMPRLVVLNSCASAAASSTDMFAGTAAALSRAGVPVVVAMQFEVTDLAARVFAGGLYTAIANGRRVDDAVSSGRVAIMGTSGRTLEWLTPVVYQRGQQSWLFRSPARTGGPAMSGPPAAGETSEPEGYEPGQPSRLAARRIASGPRSVHQLAPRPIRIVTGHAAAVIGVALSPDSARLATSGKDNRARLWDLATGNAIRTFAGHQSTVWGIAFSPDGTLATGSHDQTARIWDPGTGATVHVLRGHVDSIYEVAFSPDGALLATGSADLTARLWDSATGRPLRTFIGHESYVHGVTFSPDGALLATTSTDRTTRLWDLASGQSVRTLTGHGSAVAGVAFSPDGDLLATASSDKTVRLWRTSDGTVVLTLRGHTRRVAGVAFSPDGLLLATCSDDGTVRLWETASGTQIAVLSGHAGPVNGIAISRDGRLLATASNDRTVRIWAE
jgi:hypothetical protein